MRSRKSTPKEGNDKPVGETKATVTTVKAKDKNGAQGKKGRGRDDNDAKNAKETVTCKQQEIPYRTLVYIFFPICLMSPEITKALFDFWKQNFFVLCGVFCYTWLRFLQWVVVPERRRNELSPVWKTLCFMAITVGAVSMLPFNKTAYILEKKLLEPEECDWIINTVEEATQQMGWETSRHRYHSTEDIPADDIPEIKEFMDKVVEERLQPLVNMLYNGKMEVFDMFIVRYKIGRQVSLSEHTDAGQVSFDIILSGPKDFEGGGTYYKSLNKTLKPDKGRVLLHPAKLTHAGQEITSGNRYLIVGFSHVIPHDYSTMLKHQFSLWGTFAQRVLHMVGEPVARRAGAHKERQ